MSVPINVSLLSHTNVGKTTLARTLLRQDIGEVGDRAHVTEVAESHVLIESPQGDSLILWDTPGFGDSTRVLKRLQQGDKPVGWFLSRVWDRFADRPFWCSQQAMHNARETSDVILYVVNAGESPSSVGYVDAEIRTALQPNLCRCGTHMRILAAVRRASELMAATPRGSQ